MCAPSFAGMIGILSRPEWAGFASLRTNRERSLANGGVLILE